MTSSNAVFEVETGERYNGEVYLLHIHDVPIKSRPLRESRSSSSLYRLLSLSAELKIQS